MVDPFRTEEAFERLLAGLEEIASARWHLLQIAAFLKQIEGREAEAEPYLIEIAERLPALLADFDPVGLAPDDLLDLARRLQQAERACPVLGKEMSMADVQQRLQRAAALLLVFVGELAEALRLVTSAAPPSWIDNLEPDESPWIRLGGAIRRAEAEQHPGAEVLHELRSAWQAHRHQEPWEALVPVVEHPASSTTAPFQVGALRRVRLRLYGASEERDVLHADLRVYGAEHAAESLVEAPMAAARRLLAAAVPALAARYVEGSVRFDRGEVLHAGRSAGLALAGLFYNAVLRQHQQRQQYRLAAGAAFTGRIEEDGQVVPVDAASLPIKVRTAFFSWIDVLAVPKEQERTALAARDALAARYLHRRLDLVGIGHLREVFYDRRLTTHHRASLPRHLARRAWQRKFRIGASLLILSLLLTVGRLLYGPLDKNPVSGDLQGEYLKLKNANGATVGQFRLAQQAVHHYMKGPFPYTFIDVDGDGMNEVVRAHWEEDVHHTAFIVCTSFDGETLHWSSSLSFPLNFPERPDVANNRFIVEQLEAGDFDGDGTPEIIALLHHVGLFPGIIARYNAQTGALEDHYLHTGWLFHLALIDLNGDGKQELVAGGTNNAYDSEAVLVVLDPLHLAGHSPTQGIYKPAGYKRGRELGYMRIPRTEVGQLFRFDFAEAFVSNVVAKPDGVRFQNREVKVNDHLPPLHVDVSRDLVPLRVSVDTRYRRLVAELFAEGRISRPVDEAFLQGFMDGFLYWNGESWQHEPVMHWGDSAKREAAR